MNETDDQERDEPELEDLDVSEETSEEVRGGRRGEPPPSGPVPIPYPN